MNRHLVTVEVGVERGTNQRMQFDRFTLYQDRLERLDTQTMQSRGTVQHNRMLFDNIFQNIPHCRLQFFYHLLGIFDIMSGSVGNQLFHYKRFEQLDRHLFRQTTLIDLQLRSDNDNGTSGIVNTFTQKVLTETSGLTFQHIGKRFQRTVARSCYRTAAAAVVDQRIDCFLQHTFLIAHNDIRSAKLQQTLQTVVSVDNTAVQIVQVGSRETSSVQLYHRAQIRRDHRNRIQNHPLRTVAGLTESLHNLQTFDDTGAFLAGGILQTLFQLCGFFFQIDRHQKLFDGLSAHTCAESIAVLLAGILIFLLRQDLLVLQFGIACIQNDIICKVQNFLQSSRRQIQNQSHAGRNPFEVPDMRYRSCQLDMSHTLTAHTGLGDFYAASVADNTFITDFLIFSTMTLPVLARSEDSLTEQAVFLRFQCSVVNGLRLLYLAVGPLPDFLRGGQADLNGIEGHLIVLFICCFWHLITPFVTLRRVLYSSSSRFSSSSRNASSSSSSSTSTSSSPSNSCLEYPYSPKFSSRLE